MLSKKGVRNIQDAVREHGRNVKLVEGARGGYTTCVLKVGDMPMHEIFAAPHHEKHTLYKLGQEALMILRAEQGGLLTEVERELISGLESPRFWANQDPGGTYSVCYTHSTGVGVLAQGMEWEAALVKARNAQGIGG